MKKSQLIKLIQECFNEVISEDSNLDSARNREKQEREQWLKAKKATTDAELNALRNNKTLSETDLEEMARIPTLYSVSPNINPDSYTGTIKQIIQYLQENPGKTKMEIATGIGKNAQQAVNMIVKAMEEKGILDSQGLRSEPKYKKSDGLGTGLRGRKLSAEGAKKRAIKSVYDKLMAGAEDEITFEEDELIGDEDMKKIRELVAQGGIKRGRKSKQSDSEEPSEETFNDQEEEMYYQNDDDLNIDEPELEEPTSFENEPEFETDDELTNLINQKDQLVADYKNGKFGRVGTSESLKAYRELVGNIPQRIKALQQKERNNEEDSLMERMMKIAHLR